MKIETDTELSTLVSWIKEFNNDNSIKFLITNTLNEIDNATVINVIAPINPQNLNEILDYICRQIREKIAVHVFGDSHSIITHKIGICRENWLGFNTNYPLTMNRFANEGLNLHECIKVVGNGHQDYPVRPGDYVMYSYGEIDVRYLLLRNSEIVDNWSGNNPSRISQMDKLIDKFIVRVLENEKKFKCRGSILYGILPPAQVTLGENKFSGTLPQRLEVYFKFTKLLYSKCLENNIKILDISNEIIDPLTKTINPKFLKAYGDIHIHNDYYYLIRDALMNLLIYPE